MLFDFAVCYGNETQREWFNTDNIVIVDAETHSIYMAGGSIAVVDDFSMRKFIECCLDFDKGDYLVRQHFRKFEIKNYHSVYVNINHISRYVEQSKFMYFDDLPNNFHCIELTDAAVSYFHTAFNYTV